MNARFNLRPRRRFRRGLAFFLAAAFAAAASGQGADGGPPAPVAVESAQLRTFAPVTWYPGTVTSRNRARLAAEVSGRIESVAEVGVQVEKGETVAHLNGALLEQTLSENLAAVAREQARIKYLDAEVARLERLVVENTATRSRLDEAVANLGVARSELAANRARVRLTRERLERTVIKAPFPGVVVERLLEPGEWADEGSAVVRLVDSSSLDVQTWIPVQALKFVKISSALALKANPADATGTVRAIVPVGDERSRLYELRLSVTNVDWPVGQDLRVAVPSASPQEVVAVPRDALVLRRDGTVVYRIDDEDVAERVEVETGIASGQLIEVSGIRPGDRVVTRGGERLRPGKKVTVITPNGRQ